MISEEFWNTELKQFEIPKFECPICFKGLIISDKEQVMEKMTTYSSSIFDLTMNERDYQGHFISISKCNNPDCSEITTIAGETKLRYAGKGNNYNDDKEEFIFQGNKISYIVRYTNPGIRLFEIPENTPEEIIEIIDESFKLFWIDEDSCGNKIRSGVEKLLDLQKINKIAINKKRKRQYLNLHQRIEKFKDKNLVVSNYLFSLKWIGNQGSHNRFQLSRKELVDAYKILQLSLINLYDKTNVEVDKLTRKINKEKKHKVK